MKKYRCRQNGKKRYFKNSLMKYLTVLPVQKTENAERYTVKQMEKTKRGLEAKIKKLNDQERKDDVVTFEEIGVDRVFVDEGTLLQKPFPLHKNAKCGGIAQTEAQKIKRPVYENAVS